MKYHHPLNNIFNTLFVIRFIAFKYIYISIFSIMYHKTFLDIFTINYERLNSIFVNKLILLLLLFLYWFNWSRRYIRYHKTFVHIFTINYETRNSIFINKLIFLLFFLNTLYWLNWSRCYMMVLL